MGDTLLDNKMFQFISDQMMYEKFCESNCDNSRKRDKMKKFLILSMGDGLTDKQKYCIKQYYVFNRKQVEIAQELGVNASVVNRHISRGLSRIKKNLKYFDF